MSELSEQITGTQAGKVLDVTRQRVHVMAIKTNRDLVEEVVRRHKASINENGSALVRLRLFLASEGVLTNKLEVELLAYELGWDGECEISEWISARMNKLRYLSLSLENLEV